MECNKDEALRAKDIAVRKFTEGDYAGAKKFALKAQTLYHALDGITQMITTLEVYLSAENKINGEMDMYGILGVSPLADDETIKKQYRKLLLQLHPDKNKFIGADGAFQRVTDAFNLLSDKAKRAAYNNRRNIRTVQPKVPSQSSAPTWPTGGGKYQSKVPTHAGVSMPSFSAGRTANQKVPTNGGVSGGNSFSQQKVHTQSGNSSVPAGVNGFYESPNSTSTTSRGKATKGRKNHKASPSIQSFFKKEDTFWTKCNKCMMQYEYLRVYLNQILKCPNCQEAFAAVEVPAPSNLSSARPQQYRKTSFSSGPQKSGNCNTSTARWSPQFGTTAYNSAGYNDSVAAKASNYKFLDREKAKREYEAALAAGKRARNDDPGFVLSGELPSKNMREMNDRGLNCGGSIPSGQSKENSEGRVNLSTDFSSKSHNVGRELSAMELRKMLSEKARFEICKKLKEWKLARESAIAAKEKKKAKSKESQMSKLAANDVVMSPVNDADEETDEMVTMSVPDPDYHVFDLDRSESCFSDNQVWAAYDNDDGMPRFYAMIHKVISVNPFKVKLSWLNSKDNNEFGPSDWEGQGLIKSCGNFVAGKHETNDSLNSFSHKVSWANGDCGAIQIYPGKGDIWALYRNWSTDWKKDTAENIIHVYDMVEVLDDYNKERGVRVAPIVKVPGFLSVFSKQPEPKEVKRIPREEMFRFSHQVPSHVLTGEEGPNAPKGCIELDPAAIPSELLHK